MSAGIVTFARDVLGGLLDLVYPPSCAVCHAAGDAILCASCMAEFQPVPKPACDRCSVPLGVGAVSGGLCSACEAGGPRTFSAVHAAGMYEGSLRAAVLALKYGRRRRLAEPLGRFLGDHLASVLDDPSAWLLLPVPLHPSRLRERGFNQSELLARAAVARLGSEVDRDALARVRRTRPQASLPASERAGNILDAFLVRHPSRIEGRRVLLVDDVVTTLNTVSECARVLVDAGASEVRIAAVARGG